MRTCGRAASSSTWTSRPANGSSSPARRSAADLGRGRRGPAPLLDADAGLLERLADRAPTAGAATPGIAHRQPLAGLRVVDFTWAIAGSFATRLLADLGADVIKIESEHRLDPIRHIGPQPTAVVSLDTNGVFQDCSANKRAVTINVDTAEGQELVRMLIPTADVVTANFTPDRLDRWGFDRHALAALRPGLIVANLAVMGLSGPDAGWRSYGNGLVAMSGIAAHTGFDGRIPQCLGTMHTDFTVPYFAALQILAALHHRDRTGQGCYLEMSQFESSARLMDVELAEVLAGGDWTGAHRQPFAVVHAARHLPGRRRRPLGRHRLPRRRRASCARGRDRRAARRRGDRRLDEPAHTGRDRAGAPRAAGVPVSGVDDAGDLHDDERVRALWTALDLPSGVVADVLNEPLVWDGERLPLRRAPIWMEHTYEVLVDELGLDPIRFAELLEAKVLW